MELKLGKLEKYVFILKEFERRENRTLDAYDSCLQEELNLNSKQIGRMLKEMSLEFSNIERTKDGKRDVFKLIKPIDILEEALDDQTDIGWLFSMVHEADPETFKKLENYTDKNRGIYKFINSPFEDLSTLEEKDAFKKLKRAVKNREYVKIKFYYEEKPMDNLKCLKLIFIDNNWYVAYVDQKDKLKLGRISFIERVDYATKKESYQLIGVREQLNFIEKKLQNSMTLYEKKPQKAILKASVEIARYFEKNMKKFLPSQKFIKKQDDGSIIFSVNFTQELEILPFVQKWMPSIEILEPKELRKDYLKKLKNSIKRHN